MTTANTVVTRMAIAAMFALFPLFGNAQSVWKDPATGLTWAEQSSEAKIDWNRAGDYCKKLKTEGYSWRLATIDELNGIYDPTQSSPCGQTGQNMVCHIKGSIKLLGWNAWSSDDASSVYPKSAWLFNFNSGK